MQEGRYVNSYQIVGINNFRIFKHAITYKEATILMIYKLFQTERHSNLFISKCSGLCLDFPLSVQAVRIRQGYCLSHCDFRSSAINTQQVLPCLLGNLTVVCTCRVEKKCMLRQQAACLVFLISLKLTLLQLYMSPFHHTYFTIVNRTWSLWENAGQVFLRGSRNHLNALPCHRVYTLIPLSLPFTKLSHSRNHCMLMHRITVGASSAWNSLFSYRWDSTPIFWHPTQSIKA